jgi:hypothetical protein
LAFVRKLICEYYWIFYMRQLLGMWWKYRASRKQSQWRTVYLKKLDKC